MPCKTPVAKETQPASDHRHGNLPPKSVKGCPIVKDFSLEVIGLHQSVRYKRKISYFAAIL